MDINKAFGMIRAGYHIPPNKSKTHGSLFVDGFCMENNKPFPILNHLRATTYKHIHKSRIKIVAMIENP